MSIKGYVNELNQLNAEIKRLQARTRLLRQKSKKVEEHIVKYLQEKDQPGVKYKGTAIVMENKPKRLLKKTKEREEDALEVLRSHGVENADKVLKEIMEARKGDSVNTTKIKIKQIK